MIQTAPGDAPRARWNREALPGAKLPTTNVANQHRNPVHSWIHGMAQLPTANVANQYRNPVLLP